MRGGWGNAKGIELWTPLGGSRQLHRISAWAMTFVYAAVVLQVIVLGSLCKARHCQELWASRC